MRRAFLIIKYISASFIGVFVGFFLFFTIGSFLFKGFYKPYVILSGSMEPKLPVGSVVIAHPTDNYAVGDIVTFSGAKKTDLITHRIVEINDEGYITKGDANEDPDGRPVLRSQVAGKVELMIPYLGFVVDFAKRPQGFILFVIVPATIIIYEELRNIRKEFLASLKKLRQKTPKHSPSELSTLSDDQKLFLASLSIPLNSPPPPQNKNRGVPWYQVAIMIPVIGVASVTGVALAKSFFMDSEANTNNVLSANSSFGEKTAPLYNSDPFTCPLGATDTSSQFGFVILKKTNSDTTMKITASIKLATPNATYDLWFNQDPGACPIGAASQAGFIATDGSGNGTATIELPIQVGATAYWVSLVGGGQVLRSTSVGF